MSKDKDTLFDDIRRSNIISGNTKRTDDKKAKDRSKTSSNENSSSPTQIQIETSTDPIDKLSDNLTKGFQLMQKSFEKMFETMNEKFDEFNDYHEPYEGLYGEQIEAQVEEYGENEDNIFESLASENIASNKLGSKINGSLAKLGNKLLTNKMSLEIEKTKFENYLNPENIESACVPKTNNPQFQCLKSWKSFLRRKTNQKILRL